MTTKDLTKEGLTPEEAQLHHSLKVPNAVDEALILVQGCQKWYEVTRQRKLAADNAVADLKQKEDPMYWKAVERLSDPTQTSPVLTKTDAQKRAYLDPAYNSHQKQLDAALEQQRKYETLLSIHRNRLNTARLFALAYVPANELVKVVTTIGDRHDADDKGF